MAGVRSSLTNPLKYAKINILGILHLLEECVKYGVKYFIYASSSSVYGIKSEKNVSEDMLLEPLTDYSKFKAQCEEILISNTNNNFVGSDSFTFTMSDGANTSDEKTVLIEVLEGASGTSDTLSGGGG